MRDPIPGDAGAPEQVRRRGQRLRVVGLFSGIGGFERGMELAGHRCVHLCEIDPAAAAVLRRWFPGVEVSSDVRRLDGLPEADVLVAGFPCQDLSQAGRASGIDGERSGLVRHVFRLVEAAARRPSWIVLENVPFMLQLRGGEAIRWLTSELERLGYWWAYRVVDSMAFGLPQRRRRVFVVAAREGSGGDPRAVLLSDDVGPEELPKGRPTAYGFYWTEGNRGLGLAPDAVPPLKGGSRVPSPPAIWRLLRDDVVTPDIRDAERLQGFPEDWTQPAVVEAGVRPRERWRLVGNAVTVPVARWIGQRLVTAGSYDDRRDRRAIRLARWPQAAWGRRGEVHVCPASPWPLREPVPPITEFLLFPPEPLSARATAGFLDRVSRSSLRLPEGFLEALRRHADRMAETTLATEVAAAGSS